MKKIFAAAVLVFALTFGNQASAATQAVTFEGRYDFAEMTTGEVHEAFVDRDVDFLALRTGPSTRYPMITRIPPGARVTVWTRLGADFPERGYRDYNNNFIDVEYNGMRGFSHKGYITIGRLIRYLQ